MKQLTLVIETNEKLHQKTKKLKEIPADILETFDTMAEIMGKFDGIGLAGPQVGLDYSIAIIDAETIAFEEKKETPKEKYLKLINPEITFFSEEICTYEEGCLSLPTIYYKVDRPKTITLKYLDEKGNTKELTADGLLSRCIQHEVDHLNGKIFTDYVSALKRKLALNKLKKIKISK